MVIRSFGPRISSKDFDTLDVEAVLAFAKTDAARTEVELDDVVVAHGALRELVVALPSLRKLTLTGCRFGVATVEELAASLAAPQLEVLALSGGVVIGAAGARALGGCAGLARLRRLRLHACGIGDDGVQALASSPHLTRLEHLGITGDTITDDGAAVIAVTRHLPALEQLDLGETRVGAVGAATLASSPELVRLRHVFVSGLDETSVRSLAERFGDRIVRHGWFEGWRGRAR